MAKKKETKKTIQRKYHLFDAKGKVLGRLATEIVKVLRGKNKVDFIPHIDGGDFVAVINSDQVAITGTKLEGKEYHHFSGYPGGITTINFKDQIAKDSRKVIEMAVYGMLPKNKLRKKMMTRLSIYKDDKQTHKIDITY